jgi:hypothetical protein
VGAEIDTMLAHYAIDNGTVRAPEIIPSHGGVGYNSAVIPEGFAGAAADWFDIPRASLYFGDAKLRLRILMIRCDNRVILIPRLVQLPVVAQRIR